ncbi:MAG: CHAT domain-containing protein [Polyangia bacterium]
MIESALRETPHADRFLLQHRWKLGSDQLLEFFRLYRPDIVHFSGHGTEDNLILQDSKGNPWPLEREVAREAFRAAGRTTRRVVLNACHSRDVAEYVSEVIDCVIGMSRPVYDGTAASFAATLYRVLGEGRSVRECFDEARAQLTLSGLAGDRTPQILTRLGLDPRQIRPLQDWVGALMRGAN